MKLALHTLGCKLNQAETSSIGQRFRASGFDVGDLGTGGDVVLINSCTVTETAEIECRKLVRRALRDNPKAFVIVTGCYAQLRPEEVASIDGVDLVLGSADKHRALELATTFEKRETPLVMVSELKGVTDFGPAFTGQDDGRTRAFLKVQDGCDYRCSFCTIPKARGESRSQPIADAVAQAERLVARGFREVVLTGVNVGDFGRKRGETLLMLLQALHDVSGLARLKISSIEPNLLEEPILELMARSDRLMPHLHVPLQSGSDEVLRAMRRRYGTALYAERVAAARRLMPEVCFGADVIVGFPGETEAHFAQTCEFLSALPVSYLHVFTYSERPDTPAAAWGAQVPRAERRRRTQVLRTLSERKFAEFAASQLHQHRTVLVESRSADGMLTGLTENYLRAEFPGPEAWVGSEVTVKIGEYGAGRCVATPVPAAA